MQRLLFAYYFNWQRVAIGVRVDESGCCHLVDCNNSVLFQHAQGQGLRTGRLTRKSCFCRPEHVRPREPYGHRNLDSLEDQYVKFWDVL